MDKFWTTKPSKRAFSKNKTESSEVSSTLDSGKINLTYYQLFWIFFIGSFIGVVLESIWCLYRNGVIESRVGLVFGPFNAVYGFGAVVMSIYASRTQKTSPLFIFASCTIIGAGFEYICSVFQEIVFGSVSWYYSSSKYAFSIGGRTTMKYALIWGILGLVWVKVVYPRYTNFVNNFSANIKLVLTVVATVFMIFNMVISLLAVRRQTERLRGTAEATSVGAYLDKEFPDEKLKELFPNTVHMSDSESWVNQAKNQK